MSQSDFSEPENPGGLPAQPAPASNEGARGHGTDAPAWWTLDDQALEQAMDAAFGGNGSAENSADSTGLAAFGTACRAAFANGVDPVTAEGEALGAGPVEGGEHSNHSISEHRSHSERLRERRVIARVLARTTRGDRDSGVIDFFSEKLRRSPLLRIAAAILLVQVTVVPLIAWHLTKQPVSDGFRTGIEPPPEMFEQELPRQRDPILEAETSHDKLMLLGTSLSAPILELLGEEPDLGAALDPEEKETLGRLDHALLHLVQAARSPELPLGALRAGNATEPASLQLLVGALDLEARLMAFENARSSKGLSGSIQTLSEAWEASAASAQPAARSLAAMALRRADAMNLAVLQDLSEGPRVANESGRDWFDSLADALEPEGGAAPSASVDAWLKILRTAR